MARAGCGSARSFRTWRQRADDLCVINSMHCSNSRHGGAVLEWHTGSDTFVRPSMGSWVTYGLGSENQDFPGIRHDLPGPLAGRSEQLRVGVSAGRLPGDPARAWRAQAAGGPHPLHRRRLGPARTAAARAGPGRRDGPPPGGERGPDSELDARIASFELAFRLQTEAPEMPGHLAESRTATRRLYGLDDPDDGRLRHAVPAGAAVVGARRPVRPMQPGRLGCSQQPEGRTTPSWPAPSTSRSPGC